MRRVPLPLWPILLVAVLLSLAWALVLPATQAQDEAVHFAYTQRIVETGELSWSLVQDLPEEQPFSSEFYAAQLHSGLSATSLNPDGRGYFTPQDQRRWERAEREITDAQRSDGQFVTAMRNPPLYYLYEGAVYAPLQNAPFYTRWFFMRLATIPFVLVAVVAAWLLAGEVFGRRRWLQSVVALTVALHPMFSQLGGIINPDAAIAAIYGVGLWLAAVIVNRGVTRRRALGALGVVATAGLVHTRALPIALALLVAFAWRAWPRLRERGRWPAPVAAAGAGLVTLVVSLYVALRGDLSLGAIREFGSYLWQFYLPRPGFMTPTAADWGVRDVFVDRLWSGFAMLEVNLAPWLLDLLAWLTVAGAVLTIVTLVVRRDAVARHAGVGVVLLAALLGTLWTLHVVAWRELLVSTDPIITGRYLVPLLPLLGLSVAAIAATLPRRFGPGAATLVLGLEGLLVVSAIGTAVVRFYG